MDQYEFRQLCGRFATGVTIVTAIGEDGLPVGMTANSFASVSLDPPLISVAVDHAASMHGAMRAGTCFTINILEAHQEALSRRFAAGLPDRFEGIGWHRGPDGGVILDGVLAHIRCEKWSEVEAGDHTIVIGRVTGGAAAEHGRPLLYYRGGYGDFDVL
jgi:3-hydroxy-9,10-secoandrosta-1,3,5(10)-triene-9,17-dione monooxygenase reductase component